jgi:hypothetical protein
VWLDIVRDDEVVGRSGRFRVRGLPRPNRVEGQAVGMPTRLDQGALISLVSCVSHETVHLESGMRYRTHDISRPALAAWNFSCSS